MEKLLILALTLTLSACGTEDDSRLNSFAPSKIICDGNSLTFGAGISAPEKSYPSRLQAFFPGVTIENLGVGGQSSRQVEADAADQVDSLFTPDAVVIFWEGINSFYGDHDSAAAAYAYAVKYISDRKKAGFKTVIVTAMASENPLLASMGYRAFEAEYNALIRENAAGADIVVDLALEKRLSDSTDLSYFASDYIHMTDEGYALVAETIAHQLALAWKIK